MNSATPLTQILITKTPTYIWKIAFQVSARHPTYSVFKQFLVLIWIHKPFVITIKDLTGFTAQRIIKNCYPNPSHARKEGKVSDNTQIRHSLSETTPWRRQNWRATGRAWRPPWEEEGYLPFGWNGRGRDVRLGSVEENYRIWGSGGPDLWEPEDQLLDSVSKDLMNVYLDSVLSVGVVTGSQIDRYLKEQNDKLQRKSLALLGNQLCWSAVFVELQ